MTTTIEANETHVEMLDAGNPRPWPVRLLTILLFVQAVGLFGLAFYTFKENVLEEAEGVMAVLTLFSEIPRSLAYGSLGMLTIFAGLGFLWLWQTGWPTAMLVQGLTLLVSLGLYLRDPTQPYYIFASMSFCILMVIYLHHPDVQQAFQTKKMQEEKIEEMG